jgi:hypothetical protein
MVSAIYGAASSFQCSVTRRVPEGNGPYLEYTTIVFPPKSYGFRDSKTKESERATLIKLCVRFLTYLDMKYIADHLAIRN